MNEESLVKLCMSSFSSEEIESAKSLLFESVPTAKKKINRKKDGRSKRDLFDVISLFKEVDPDLIPVFVARDLQKLPPIHFDHVDPTKLLKDLLIIQNELRTIKESYVTEQKFNEIKNELTNLKNASLVNNNFDCYISKKRGGSNNLSNSYFLDSGPVGLPHFSDAERNTAQSTAERCESLPRSTCVAEACAAAPGPRASTLAADCVPPLSEPALEHAPAPSIPSMTSNRQAPALVNECARIVTSIGNAPLLQSSPEQSPAMYRVECGTNVNTSLHDSFANVVETAKQWKVEKPNEQWVLVQKKRLKIVLVHWKAKHENQEVTSSKLQIYKCPCSSIMLLKAL
ncbi:hypothetical protein HF086_014763 [Spodoptera exigua]|uniref:Mutant cadherin n=1 Tax=Spodoptera exigua TaxID=7107 RepID=A0A922MJK1_SPOEX|nr:hypothetical protein HF086_014763 [Spodoptera exigua]